MGELLLAFRDSLEPFIDALCQVIRVERFSYRLWESIIRKQVILAFKHGDYLGITSAPFVQNILEALVRL